MLFGLEGSCSGENGDGDGDGGGGGGGDGDDGGVFGEVGGGGR